MRPFFLLACFIISGVLQAQTAEDSVRQVVIDFFQAMKRSDTATMRACLTSTVHFESMLPARDAEPRLVQESVPDFLVNVGRFAPGSLDERIEFGTVLVDGPMASVWTPYEFYFNGKYNHCGVDSFQLVRILGKWQIQYLIDTRRKSCQPKSTSK